MEREKKFLPHYFLYRKVPCHHMFPCSFFSLQFSLPSCQASCIFLLNSKFSSSNQLQFDLHQKDRLILKIYNNENFRGLTSTQGSYVRLACIAHQQTQFARSQEGAQPPLLLDRLRFVGTDGLNLEGRGDGLGQTERQTSVQLYMVKYK